MTDTTDIAALREKYELALKDLTERLMECNRLNYCMDEITAFAAFSSTVIDQLEAERQRGDALQAEGDEFRRRLKLERSILEDADKELAALKAKLANPVVLPARFKPEVSKVDVFKGSPVMKLDTTGGWLNRTGAIVAINAAGFTVKGE
ncbi:hypothetical protein Rahaq_4976 (plasmid) [Rahnella aceris]|uniref:Uncharacterized protein n=1 Tax=Rahnella sp. (strain Y9602) TaxID=2703885 RepID=A0A0H3FJP4_RAHSY|nr:hypothetical protein [Rahnella aceris]ADW76551.1 hypothetical protein Rahaq_4976 [Rahnella aceris]